MSSDYSKEVKKILSSAGCRFVRRGKGDHDIWYSPISSKHFPVDASIQSRHTANAVLKQAGIEKAFQSAANHNLPKANASASCM